MSVSLKSNRRRSRGAAAAEFALLLPFIMFVFAVGADWCRVYYYAHTIEDCARSGALASSGIAYQERNLSDSEREARGRTEALKGATNLDPPLGPTDITVATVNNYVTVTVDYDFHTVVPYLGAQGTWSLSRRVRMPVMP